MTIYALDFDGVLCDSALETGIAGWKAGGALWADMRDTRPPADLLVRYRLVRPALETGHEAILMMRLLRDGESPESVLRTFPQRLPGLIECSGMGVDGLKRLFAATRDRWIEDTPAEWLASNPFYPGIVERLHRLPQGVSWAVVTTKQERFVSRLLEANGLGLQSDYLFGLDRGLPKEQVLRLLQGRHRGQPLHFVEDRLATLERIAGLPDLARVHLYLACWGYNTETDRRAARQLPVTLWQLPEFLSDPVRQRG